MVVSCHIFLLGIPGFAAHSSFYSCRSSIKDNTHILVDLDYSFGLNEDRLYNEMHSFDYELYLVIPKMATGAKKL